MSSASGFDTHKKWSGTVESRLRQLVMKLENSGDAMLDIAHPFVKGFEQATFCLTEDEVRMAAQGEVSEELRKRTKEEIEGKQAEGARAIYTMTFYIGLEVKPKQRQFPVPFSLLSPFFSRHHPAVSDPLGFLSSAPLLSLAGDPFKRKLDISYPTNDFMKQVKMIDTFDEATMGIVIKHIKKCGPFFP